MSPDKLFSACSSLALISWIILIFFPFWKKRDLFILSTVILLFALLYSYVIFSNITPEGFKNFNSLDGVSQLFSNKFLLLAGWIHYLAFDLLAGIYITRNAMKNSINHWVTVPALFCTFLLGPFGLLLYFIIRFVKTRKFLQDNF